jgi:DNA repair photolyase
MKEVIKEAKYAGVKHVTSSTYKARKDNLQRICNAFPEFSQKWKKLYIGEGKWIHGSLYLPKNLRLELMMKVRKIAESYRLTFACCREALNINSEVCDGSFLFKENK